MQNLSNISVIRDLLTRYGFTFPRPWARISSSIRRSAPVWQNWAALRPAPV